MKNPNVHCQNMFDGETFRDQLKPAWTPVNIAAMVLFFIIGLPFFGLLAIGYMLFGRNVGLDFSKWGSGKGIRRAANNFGWSSSRTASSGNAAFDAWRDAEIERLKREKEKLDEAREAFEAHMRELRMARDREEFDAFKRAWQQKRNNRQDPDDLVDAEIV